VSRVEYPLIDGGQFIRVENPKSAKELDLSRCSVAHAVELVREWHSTLPNVQPHPWQYAFKMHRDGVTYAVALWNTPSARMLPQYWLELRRMACAPDAPKYTASRFLSSMVRWFKRHALQREMCISYQDSAVHTGTIYRAAGWTIGNVSKPRVRNRSKPRRGTKRAYRRTNFNDRARDVSGKVRWEMKLV
jgi:hypothetical protein